jgi:hypothetical protein
MTAEAFFSIVNNRAQVEQKEPIQQLQSNSVFSLNKRMDGATDFQIKKAMNPDISWYPAFL